MWNTAAQHIAETNVASEQSDVVAMPLPPQQPTTYYSVWLCPCERKTPALHQLLTAEIVDGAIRTRAPYKPFTPHITLASHLEGFGDDEDSRVAQFREFVASIKVLELKSSELTLALVFTLSITLSNV